MWGTVGWIVAGIAVGQWLLHRHTPSGPGVTAEMVKSAQAAGRADAFKPRRSSASRWDLLLLPPAHAPSKGARKNAAFEALAEVRRNPLLTLFLVLDPVRLHPPVHFRAHVGFLSAFQNEAASAINSVLGVGGGGLMTIGQSCRYS